MLFVDESGTPPKRSASNPRPYFVLAGVIIPEDEWHGLRDDLQSLKGRACYRIKGEIKWRFFGERDASVTTPLSHLSFDKKCAFRRDFFGLLTSRHRLRIIACVTAVAAAYQRSYIANEEDLYEMTYKPVTERFQYYLQDCQKGGDKTLGIVICDHRGRKQDERLRRHHQKLVSSNSSVISNYANMTETLFLAPSHLSVGIQFADMIAGAVGRFYNFKDRTCASIIKPNFRVGPNGKIAGYGLVRFPSN